MFLASIFEKTIDFVFFISIISGVVLVIIWVLSIKLYHNIKSKKEKNNELLREERIKRSNESKNIELESNDIKEDTNNIDEEKKEDIESNIDDESDENNEVLNNDNNIIVDDNTIDDTLNNIDTKEDKEDTKEDKENLDEDINEVSNTNEDNLDDTKNVDAFLFDDEEVIKNNESLDENNEVLNNDDNIIEDNTIDDDSKENIESNIEEKENNIDEERKEDSIDNIEKDNSLDDIEEFPIENNIVESDNESKVEDTKDLNIDDNPKPKKLKGVIPVKKGRTYNGKYEVFQVADGYSYRLKASNGEILVQSETFTSHDGALKAIDAVKRNLETGEIKIFSDKNGKFKFKLTSKNYRVLAVSSNYTVEKSAVRAKESFIKFALKADIVDVDVVDKESLTATPIEIKDITDKDNAKFSYEKYNGIYSWELLAPNGEILCQSDGYTTKNGVLYSIETFKRNLSTGTFKCVSDKNLGYSFRLYNGLGRVCAIGESYSSKQQAINAANSVMSYYKNAKIVENKNNTK